MFDRLELVCHLDGATGPLLVEDPQDGRRYVLKRGARPAHALEELRADAAYRALGVPVPPSCRLDTPDGPMRLAAFVVGPTLAELSPNEQADACVRLCEGFAADVLLGNHDVPGWHWRNVVVDEGGVPWRVDNGAALRFSGRGTAKGTNWGPTPAEFWELRDTAVHPEATEAFRSLDPATIACQVADLAARSDAVLEAVGPELAHTVGARLAALQELASCGMHGGGT